MQQALSGDVRRSLVPLDTAQDRTNLDTIGARTGAQPVPFAGSCQVLASVASQGISVAPDLTDVV